MSKSPNLFLSGAAAVALMLGLGYGFSARNYGENKIATLEDRLGQVEAQNSAAREDAKAKADEAASLEAKIAEIQKAAKARPASTALSSLAPEPAERLGLGRAALVEEIAAWDVDVLPDGRGLPEGRGDVLTGEEVFADACASCHGDFAEGVDNWPVLAGGFDTLGDKDPVKTVGSYWPHLSTVWDYVHRSMPFGGAQTLSDDDVYAIVAYILYSNDMVDEDFELSHENFDAVTMHNSNGFVLDDRPDVEYTSWRAEPCMENCKDSVQITMRASILDVTPEDGGEAVMNHAATSGGPTFSASGETETAETTDVDPALIQSGEKVFKKCKSCHQIGEGAKNRSGPMLTGVMGRAFGTVDGFKYSGVFKEASSEGRIWSDDEMAAFLTAPKVHMNGTRMNFPGLKKEADVDAVIAYLKSFGD